MKKFVTAAKGTCWRDAIGCMLEVNPKKIPHFVKECGDKYMDATRLWLRENFKKGLVFIPSREFMEVGKMRNNGPLGPEGYSIGVLEMVSASTDHVVICFNGGVVWDNGEDRHSEYSVLTGYFVIYDLEPPKAKLIKKSKKKRVKKRSSIKTN
jgi:hypothetical protein